MRRDLRSRFEAGGVAGVAATVQAALDRVGLIATLALVVTSCAGIDVLESHSAQPLSGSAHLLVFPFRDPTLGEKQFRAVGGRFTNAFATACAKQGLTALPVFSNQFSSERDVSLPDAMIYARQSRAGFIATGYVGKWVDRATEWSGMRDFAALSVVVRDVSTGRVVASVEVQPHSNIFWSGTPDDYVRSVAERAAEELVRLRAGPTPPRPPAARP